MKNRAVCIICVVFPIFFPIVFSKNLTILLMVPWPDAREYAGWDVGLSLIPGGRIAVREINNRSDILAGYRINIIEAGHDACGLTDHSLGLTNLVREAVNPWASSGVVAVVGLFCSSNTVALSPVAGRDGIDLLQIAGSYSPIFKKNLKRFPHLWRLIPSADVYAQIMIHLAKNYGWSNVAVVCSPDNAFYAGIASSLVNLITEDKTMNLVYDGTGLVRRIQSFQRQILSDLVTTNARIVFLAAESAEIADLLCLAINEGMQYPQYLWVIADWKFEFLVASDSTCNRSVLTMSLEGSLFFYIYFVNETDAKYENFAKNYRKELETIQNDYRDLIVKENASVIEEIEYAAVLYNQIYAISMALHNSLPELIAKNISLENYGFGQSNTTDIIEKSLRNVSFQGFAGDIKFNDNQEGSLPVIVYQVVEGNSNVVGLVMDVDNILGTKFDLTFDDQLDDMVPIIYVTVDTYLFVIMVICISVLFVLTTLMLVLLVKYRNVRIIKADSVKVSSLMFIACYLFMMAEIVIVILSKVKLTPIVYSILCNFMYFLIYNAFVLLFSTQLLKQRRIHRIFSNSSLKVYSWRYSNWMLILKAISFCLVGNAIWVLSVSVEPTRQNFFNTTRLHMKPHQRITTQFSYPYCHAEKSDYIFYGLYLYLALLLLLNIYLASWSAKTLKREQDFKNTKKINLFMVAVFITLSLSIPFREAFFKDNRFVLYLNVVLFFCTFIPAFLSQMILFLPMITMTVLEKTKVFSQLQSSFTNSNERKISIEQGW